MLPTLASVSLGPAPGLPTWLPGASSTASRRSLTALGEVAIMFLPSLPAYLWLWPRVSGTLWLMPVQIAFYLYFLAGALFIGLRRWTPSELGLNRQGIGLSIICGLILLGTYHIGWQGLLGALGTGFLGLIFAVIRLRAGGILGLVLVRGALDLVSVEFWPTLGWPELRQLQGMHRELAMAADLLLLLLMVYLWRPRPALPRLPWLRSHRGQ